MTLTKIRSCTETNPIVADGGGIFSQTTTRIRLQAKVKRRGRNAEDLTPTVFLGHACMRVKFEQKQKTIAKNTFKEVVTTSNIWNKCVDLALLIVIDKNIL